MTDKKGWGSTVVGWFIEKEGPAADSSAATVPNIEDVNFDFGQSAATYYAQTSDPAASETAAAASSGQILPPAIGGQVDFDAVFEASGVDADERGRVAKAVALLRSLPAETDVAIKKQIVEASLKAFGVPIEQIIEAGAAEIQALEYYIRGGAADTEKLLQESAERIQQYEQEVANVRRVMDERVTEQQLVVKACNEKKLEVQQILEFFGRDAVARVVKASPKLTDPSSEAQSPTST